MESDGKGRFVNGHSSDPGRPSRRTELDYLAAMQEQVSIPAWREIIKQAGLSCFRVWSG
jgi:hypothetical protein